MQSYYANPFTPRLILPLPQKQLTANDIATAMEMLTAGVDITIIALQTGVNHIHIDIAKQFGFDVYKPTN